MMLFQPIDCQTPVSTYSGTKVDSLPRMFVSAATRWIAFKKLPTTPLPLANITLIMDTKTTVEMKYGI